LDEGLAAAALKAVLGNPRMLDIAPFGHKGGGLPLLQEPSGCTARHRQVR
jgi:hypothetical protein